MIVRRISYFTFMVAITTMATVGSCQKANAHCISFEDFNSIVAALSEHEIFDFSFNAEEAALDYNAQLQKLLKTRGLKAETLQVQATPTKGNVLNLVLVVDKSTKGTSNPVIFTPHTGHIPLQRSCNHTAIAATTDFPAFDTDLRVSIARKNLVLLI